MHRPEIGQGILQYIYEGHMLGTVTRFDNSFLEVVWVNCSGNQMHTKYAWVPDEGGPIRYSTPYIDQPTYHRMREQYLKLL